MVCVHARACMRACPSTDPLLRLSPSTSLFLSLSRSLFRLLLPAHTRPRTRTRAHTDLHTRSCFLRSLSPCTRAAPRRRRCCRRSEFPRCEGVRTCAAHEGSLSSDTLAFRRVRVRLHASTVRVCPRQDRVCVSSSTSSRSALVVGALRACAAWVGEGIVTEMLTSWNHFLLSVAKFIGTSRKAERGSGPRSSSLSRFRSHRFARAPSPVLLLSVPRFSPRWRG